MDDRKALAPRAKICSMEFVRDEPSFSIIREKDGSIEIEGDYELFAEYGNVILAENYRIKIVVPNNYPAAIPQVFELSNNIPGNYEHKYRNGALCLGINGEIAASIAQDDSLARFLNGFVRDALYSAKYYHRFGKYPFGDRKHGASGILAYYSELFSVDQREAFLILDYIIKNKYRGHLPCPCNSGLKNRDCHGSKMLEIIHCPIRYPAVLEDYMQITNTL